MINRVKQILLHKDARSKDIKINTILNVIYRGLSILCSYLIVTVALSYINKNEYGVWLTLTSITAWLSYMDVGLGNGMRNKLAEAIAKNDKILAQEFVSTTYIVFSIVIFLVFASFGITNIFLNWNIILKTNIAANILLIVTYVIVFSFCLRLILNLAITVVVALQKVYIDSLISFLVNFFTLITIYLLPKFYASSFSVFSISLSIVPLIVLVSFNLFLFYISPFKYLKPQIRYFNRRHLKSLLNIGTQFFFIQLIGIIIFSTDNILITQFFSSGDVTAFNVAYKYFSISTLVFTIILVPYWSTFTSSYIQKDFVWIRNAFKKLIVMWGLQVIFVALLISVSSFFYYVWVGKKVSIPFSLSISLGIYSVVYNWNNIFAYFINGVSKIRLQLYSAFFAGIINIPLSYLLVKFTDFGVSSIVLANTICLLLSSVWSPIQCYKIVNNKATGIWNK